MADLEIIGSDDALPMQEGESVSVGAVSLKDLALLGLGGTAIYLAAQRFGPHSEITIAPAAAAAPAGAVDMSAPPPDMSAPAAPPPDGGAGPITFAPSGAPPAPAASALPPADASAPAAAPAAPTTDLRAKAMADLAATTQKMVASYTAKPPANATQALIQNANLTAKANAAQAIAKLPPEATAAQIQKVQQTALAQARYDAIRSDLKPAYKLMMERQGITVSGGVTVGAVAKTVVTAPVAVAAHVGKSVFRTLGNVLEDLSAALSGRGC